MKKILLSALLFSGLALFTACEDDNDSNPVVQQPDTFQLNAPALSGNAYDLERTSAIRLTCQQPDYGYTAPVTYYVQVSPTGTWNEATSEEANDATYVELDGSFTTCEVEADASQVNRAILKLNNWLEESLVPTSPVTVYVRLRATLTAGYPCYSNVIQLSVVPYYTALTAVDPELWYLVGDCIGDGSWGGSIGTAVIPMSLVDGYSYNETTGLGELTFTGYFPAGKGFKLVRDITNGSIDWTNQWGSSDGALTGVKNDGGSSNFAVPTSGYYTITLNTKDDEISIVPADDRTAYSQMLISGDFNGWATDVQMTPVNTTDGMVNHIWHFELDATSGDTTAKFLADSSWSPNWGAADFPYGIGSNGGANIPVPAGKYVVVFNDIDGYYHFFAQ